ncbi:hypothetical protein SAMN05192558_1239 [Actinokineospora alba]|uniref:Uncharacterized protein n=1 Tax=Actinokineospora alba TaxID=504798 RepID=A0A1H0WKW5_9PSEU|nr:hypothetical protein [Actinokineospora alba]TDP66233.1 hypothetical protein C8E96_1733 [Actinokineospora alba]SDJ43619.1 hypothetical protein SAMN05421871_115114 [Actinokineospora alba]SDP91322.1 hypothetical protein SAMN05192558_1239 [Actinokineospora alba]
MGKAQRREAPAVEPPTDIPAMTDPHTARAYRDLRVPLLGLPVGAVVFGVPAIFLRVGWVATAVLGVIALAFLIATVVSFSLVGTWLRPAEKLLKEQPWREATVKVYRSGRGLPRTKMRVDDGKTKLSLRANALPWAAQQVLARTGRIWIVGPSADGWVAIRSAGLALPLGPAQVVKEDVSNGYEIAVEQEAPLRVPLAAADAVLAKSIATPRRQAKTDLIGPAILLLIAVVLVVDLIQRGAYGAHLGASIGLGIGTLAFAALLVWRIRKLRYWITLDRLLGSGPWRSVPVTADGHGFVATLDDGKTARVKLGHRARQLRANVTATGLLWIAGPTDGKAAAGLPGYPFLTIAVFQDQSGPRLAQDQA